MGLPPHEQRLDHPACDHAPARHADGVRGDGGGAVGRVAGRLARLRPCGRCARVVWRAARRAGPALVLRHGLYRGGDMHPSHLVSRFAPSNAFPSGPATTPNREAGAGLGGAGARPGAG
ncbi:DUF6986 family protein [Nonomuraea rubra]|uniref:DUF6986 family protein n=1 Tax=Nonomuraea rubra TaxID=46180 RepID=UPI003CD06DE3